MFKKFLDGSFLLMNEFESGDSGSGPSEASYSEEMDSILAEEGMNESNSDELGDTVSLNKESEEEEKSEEKSVEENNSMIDKFLSENDAAEEGQADEEENESTEEENGEWLEDVNKLGLKHDGKEFEVQSSEHAKELMQKGYDYTQKTQQLSEERKSWESERETAQNELKELEQGYVEKYNELTTTVQENQIFEQVLNEIKNEDPDLLEEIKAKYQKVEGQVNNPIYRGEIDRVNQKLSEIEQSTQREKASFALKEFDLEFKENKDLLEEFKTSLGLEIDSEVIKGRWMQGDDVKKAIFAEYGDKILKLSNSKKKVAKNASAVRPKKALGGRSARRSGQATAKKVNWGDSYNSLANQLLESLD